MVVADLPLAVRSSTLNLAQRRQSKETNEEFVGRLTHLHLQGKRIDTVRDLSFCGSLRVLYLHDNAIRKIQNLHGLRNLEELFLQNNAIERVEHLNHLHNLSKLYLGHNAIGVIEGLEGLQLRELHVEGQNLSPGEKLLFDPCTMEALAPTLEVLNISNNCLDSLEDIEVLKFLSVLTATQNNLSSLDDVISSIAHKPDLHIVNLSSNPICRDPHYRKQLITMVTSLDFLDGKEITSTSKNFLQRLQRQKVLSASRMASHGDVCASRRAASVPAPPTFPRKEVSEEDTIFYGSTGHLLPSFERIHRELQSNDSGLYVSKAMAPLLATSDEEYLRMMVPRPFWRAYVSNPKLESSKLLKSSHSLPNVDFS